jgi:hypothetical protein
MEKKPVFLHHPLRQGTRRQHPDRCLLCSGALIIRSIDMPKLVSAIPSLQACAMNTDETDALSLAAINAIRSRGRVEGIQSPIRDCLGVSMPSKSTKVPLDSLLMPNDQNGSVPTQSKAFGGQFS